MKKKKFNCKMEDVPVIAGFVLTSLDRDKDDFNKYSTVFNDVYVTKAREKQMECYEIIKSGDVLKHQKMVKVNLDATLRKLRLALNLTEGYIKLAHGTLDIQESDFGLRTIRVAITLNDVERVILQGHTLISHVKRNAAALQIWGLKPEAILALEALINEIDDLNENHNSKKNERSRTATDNVTVFNEMWDTISTIANAGRAMYRGVDNVKLREYTKSHLLKRVYAENPNATVPSEPKTETPAS